jgi:mRNA interferase HigB
VPTVTLLTNARYKITKKAKWGRFQEVTQTFNNADFVGSCVVFNVGGNKCRLISYIRFSARKLYILQILSHAEYDQEAWKDDCDCD